LSRRRIEDELSELRIIHAGGATGVGSRIEVLLTEVTFFSLVGEKF
jgi:hypothetical protein